MSASIPCYASYTRPGSLRLHFLVRAIANRIPDNRFIPARVHGEQLEYRVCTGSAYITSAHQAQHRNIGVLVF